MLSINDVGGGSKACFEGEAVCPKVEFTCALTGREREEWLCTAWRDVKTRDC